MVKDSATGHPHATPLGSPLGPTGTSLALEDPAGELPPRGTDVFFATHLPLTNPDTGAATFEYTCDLRAEVAGRFTALPAHAEAVYAPETSGRSDAATITVEPN